MAEIRVKFIPEIEKQFMQAFAQEIADTMKSAGAGKGDKGGGGGGGFSLGVGAGGVAKIAGLGALAGGGTMAIVEMMIQQFKPLVSMIKEIGRILMEFLRPIAEIVQFLLQPILLALRPLLQMFNAIMAPYRQAAMQLSADSSQAFAEGDMARGTALAGLAAATILRPIQDMLWEIAGGVLKGIVDMQTTMMKILVKIITEVGAIVVGIFSDEAAEKVRDLGKVTMQFMDAIADVAKVGIDRSIVTIKNEINSAMQAMAKALGSDVIFPTFADPANGESLVALTTQAFAAFGADIKGVIDGTFDPDKEDGMIAAFRSGLKRMEDSVKKDIDAMFDRLERRSGGGGSFNGSGSTGSWQSGVPTIPGTNLIDRPRLIIQNAMRTSGASSGRRITGA